MSTTTPLVPHDTSAARARRKRLLSILTVLAVVGGLIIIGVLLAYLRPAPFRTAYETVRTIIALHRVPDELATAQFISEDQYGAQTAYHPGTWKFEPVPLTYAPAVSKALADPVNQKLNLIIRDTTVSPSGNGAAFSILRTGREPKSPRDWLVSFEDMNGAKRSIGTGLAPFFVDETHIGRFTANGIVIVDYPSLGTTTATTTGPVALSKDFGTMPMYPRVSPDGHLIAYLDTQKDQVVVLDVRKNLEKVGTYDKPFTSFALSNDHVYLLSEGTDGTEVVSYPLAGNAPVRTIYTLPAYLHISDIRF